METVKFEKIYSSLSPDEKLFGVPEKKLKKLSPEEKVQFAMFFLGKEIKRKKLKFKINLTLKIC